MLSRCPWSFPARFIGTHYSWLCGLVVAILVRFWWSLFFFLTTCFSHPISVQVCQLFPVCRYTTPSPNRETRGCSPYCLSHLNDGGRRARSCGAGWRESAPDPLSCSISLQVNISAECREKILATDVTAFDLFDDARAEVLAVMEVRAPCQACLLLFPKPTWLEVVLSLLRVGIVS